MTDGLKWCQYSCSKCAPRTRTQALRRRLVSRSHLWLRENAGVACWCARGAVLLKHKQELSYRKQIARQLRTQYVEGIYDNPVTLKPRLMVTQGHWKRNNRVDHTRLTIRRVIGRWILSWPWNVGQRSLKVIEISAIRKLGCGFLFAFYTNYARICSRLWDIQCQTMAWPWKPD